MAVRKKKKKAKKRSTKKKAKRKAGRPRAKLSIKEVAKLAHIGATDEEISDWFGVDVRTIERRKKTDAAFCRALKKGRAHMKISLRRSQLQSALGGSVGAQVWLGKQLLGQREPPRDFGISAPDGGPVKASVTVRYVGVDDDRPAEEK